MENPRHGSADLVAGTFIKVPAAKVVAAVSYHSATWGRYGGVEPPSNKMPCYHPVKGWKPADGGSLVFDDRAERIGARPITIPCGRCVGCRLERSRQWAMRCLHEASRYEANQFVTLTYNAESLPAGGTLNYEDYCKFMKRLRKHFRKTRLKFYMAGEYGEQNWRPHYHAIIFGLDLPDRLCVSEAANHYESKSLEKIWGLGGVIVGDVTFESAAYVARYVMKKVTGDRAEAHYRRIDVATGETWQLKPEFNVMSKGVGKSWIERYRADVYNYDYVVVNGQKCKPPRYYDKVLAETDPDALEFIRFQRELKAAAHVDDTTPARLAARERVAKAALSLKRRSLSE